MERLNCQQQPPVPLWQTIAMFQNFKGSFLPRLLAQENPGTEQMLPSPLCTIPARSRHGQRALRECTPWGHRAAIVVWPTCGERGAYRGLWGCVCSPVPACGCLGSITLPLVILCI